jgi:hypothetical protein
MEFAAQLGIKYNTFMKHLDSTRPLWSPSLNMYITLLQAGSSPVDAVIQGPYLTTDPIKGVDLHSLPQGIIALAKDKVTRLGVYLSAGQAAFLLDGKVDRTYIYRYINIEYLVSTSLGLVYFVMNPGYVAPASGGIAPRGTRGASQFKGGTKGVKSPIFMFDSLRGIYVKFPSKAEASAFI